MTVYDGFFRSLVGVFNDAAGQEFIGLLFFAVASQFSRTTMWCSQSGFLSTKKDVRIKIKLPQIKTRQQVRKVIVGSDVPPFHYASVLRIILFSHSSCFTTLHLRACSSKI